ncbi:MAG: GNAT family N-acetyltransferase [Desulfobaccales bacterium]
MALPLPQPQAAIRAATPEDLPAVMEIESLAFEKRWGRYEFKASLEDTFLVAEDPASGRLTGYLIACCCRLTRRGMILRLAVHPDYRRQGVAKALLEAAFEELRRQGLTEVVLDVDVVKGGAQKLYEEMGFQVAEVISLCQEDEEESFYVMRRRL